MAEGLVLRSLSHPNIVRVHDVYEEDDTLNLVLDYVEAGSLSERLGAGPIPEDEAVVLICEVLGALAACHAAGVVHRDVKPGNILISADGTTRLVDFGIAKAESGELTRTGEALGTWAFMAPEQRLDSRRVDARADVYGAGATLYTMLTGEPPFDLANPVLSEDRIARLSPRMAGVVRRATNARPEGRWPSALAMREALLGLEVPFAAEEPSVADAPRPALANPRRWVTSTLATVVGIAVIALAAAHNVTSPAPFAPAPAPPAPAVLVADPTPLTALPAVVAAKAPPAPHAAAKAGAAVASPGPSLASPAPALAAVDAPSPAAPVRTVVNSLPWSEVEIDGQPVGRTPWRGDLAAGPHRIQLTTGDGRTSESTTSGSESTVCWDFSRQGRCAP